MKTHKPLSPIRFQRLFLLPGLLAAYLLTGCSSEKRDQIWQTIDPAGYKHAHSESFNGARALRRPEPSRSSESGDIPLELN